MDPKKIDDLAERFVRAREVSVQQKSYDLLLSAMSRYLRSLWSKGHHHTSPGEYEEACHWVLEEALRTHDRSKGRFATWCGYWMRSWCDREARRQSGRRVETARHALGQVMRERQPRGAGAELIEEEQLALVQRALEQESDVSRMVVTAWSCGNPAPRVLAELLERTVESIRQTRFRNLRHMGEWFRNRGVARP